MRRRDRCRGRRSQSRLKCASARRVLACSRKALVGANERFAWSHPGEISDVQLAAMGETPEQRLASLAHGFALTFIESVGGSGSGRGRLRTMMPPPALLQALRSGGDIAPSAEHWSWYTNHIAIDPAFALVAQVSVLLFTVTFYANLAHSLTRSP